MLLFPGLILLASVKINLILSNTVILIAYVILEPFGFWNWGVLNYLRRPLSNPELGADGGKINVEVLLS